MADRSDVAEWRLILAALGPLLLVMPVVAHAQSASPDKAWVSLFNERNLDGWTPKIRGYVAGDNFGQTFRVDDGLLTVSYDQYERFDGRYGHLFYVVPYSHYRLRLDYRFVGSQVAGGPAWAERNSGVMLHAQAPDTMPAGQDFPIAVEFQFLGGLGDGTERSTGNLCTPGTNVVFREEPTRAHCIESTAPTFDGDQWVHVEALVLGSRHFEHFVNGVRVIEYDDVTTGGGAVSGHRPELEPEGEPLGSGYIALQSESHPVQFRRIEILNLRGCMNPDSPQYRRWFVEPDPAACR